MLEKFSFHSATFLPNGQIPSWAGLVLKDEIQSFSRQAGFSIPFAVFCIIGTMAKME
jgi:hypothetical protein